MRCRPKLLATQATVRAVATLLLLGCAIRAAGEGVSLSFKEFPCTSPDWITAGPDGALWFTVVSNYIGRITTAGVISGYYPVPTPGSNPMIITTGPDGALWFTEFQANKIGRITIAGLFAEFPIPTPNSYSNGITAGPDGALWFTEYLGNKIGRITTSGAITEYPIPTQSSLPDRIVAGSDGALWFTEESGNQIGRITTSGAITEYPIPTVGSYPRGITAGPDGALWFAEQNGNRIGRITTAGVLTEFAIPTPNSQPQSGIAVGPDGALWFTEFSGNRIGRITTSGAITEYPVPSANSAPYALTLGADGALWFTEYNAGKIGQAIITIDATNPVSHVSPLPASEAVANFPVRWSGSDTGSGVRNFSIYVSDSSGPFTTWLSNTEATQSTYPGVLGHTYGFYSIATDWAGNVENPKSPADTTTFIAAAPGDLNGDGAVNCADVAVVMSSFGKTAGQPGYNPIADVNHDAVVNVKDLSWVSQYLPPGKYCPQ